MAAAPLTPGFTTSPKLAFAKVRLVVAVPKTIDRLVAPTARTVPLASVYFWKPKLPVSETKLSTTKVTLPCTSVTLPVPARPLKSRLTLPPGVATEPVIAAGSSPLRTRTCSPVALRVRPGTPFKVSVPPWVISA